MALAVRITRTGSPYVMTLERITEQSPGPGQVWIEHEAIGVNYLDVTQSNGAVSIPLPSGLGLEGAGQVTTVAADVTNVRPGDRVAYATGPIGAYSTGRIYPADRLVPLPREITAQEAASVLFKGITAQYLIKSTYPVGPEKVVVLYGAAGGVGQIMARWAKHLRAKVIGIVSKEASVARRGGRVMNEVDSRHVNDRTSYTCRLVPRHRLSCEQRASRIGKFCASLSGGAIMISKRRP